MMKSLQQIRRKTAWGSLVFVQRSVGNKFWSHGCNSAARNLVKLFVRSFKYCCLPNLCNRCIAFCLAKCALLTSLQLLP